MMLPGVLGVLGLCRLALRAMLPIDCIACARPLRMDSIPYVCDACWDRITPISGPRCARCDQPFASHAANTWSPAHCCQSCLKRPPAFDRAWTLYPYIPPLQDAICALKYRSVFGLARHLAALMIHSLPEELEADLIAPGARQHDTINAAFQRFGPCGERVRGGERGAADAGEPAEESAAILWGGAHGASSAI